MNKQEILQHYKNDEERLLVAKIIDQYEFAKSRNKIQYSNFLNLREQEIALKVLNDIGYNNCYLTGGTANTERKVLAIYSENLTEEMSRKNDSKILSVVRIILPKDLEDEYEHRIYLGGIIKLGIEREKIGDIIVNNLGADIIVKTEIKEFLLKNLNSLTRFQSSKILSMEIKDLPEVKISKVEISSIVASLRLDNIVSVLARTSRNKALDILKQERVFLNHKVEVKPSKQVKAGDIITIRGKGRFEFKEIAGNTKKGRFVIKIDKYI